MTLTRPAVSQLHLIAALVTPFTSEHEVDRASLARLVAHLRAGGVEEYFAVGSTGEAPVLDESDRLTIIETVRGAAAGGRVYAGISGAGVKGSIRNAREAQRAGADVAVIMAPNFIAFSQEQLAGYCEAVAEASPLPLAVYHHLRMPTPFSVATVARLAAHPNIVAIKDTNGGENNRCAEILAATAGRDFQFLQGVENLVLPTLRAGGHGCVVAQACIAPRMLRGIFDAWAAGDEAGAEAGQKRLSGLWGMFSRPEVRQSFAHFIHTLKLPLRRRGVIATTEAAVGGTRFDAEYERMIMDFMQGHLEQEI